MGLGLLPSGLAVARTQTDPITAHQDGILAEAIAGSDRLDLRWRFRRPLDHPLDTITAEVNGRPLGAPQIRPYPQDGERTVILFLVDVSDPRRLDEIRKNKAALLELVAQLRIHHSIGIVAYAGGVEVLPADWNNVDELVESIVGIAPKDEPADRDGALLKSLDSLGALPAARRAMFVLTDGHTDTETRTAQLIATANKYDVAVTYIVATRSNLRALDRASLVEVAASTGGQVVEAEGLARFLAEPYALTDNGAEIGFPLAGAFRLPWERSPEADLRMRYGAKVFEVKVPVMLPRATTGQILAYAAASPALAGGIAATALAPGAALLVFWRRRNRIAKQKLRESSRPDPSRAQGNIPAAATAREPGILAVLQDLDQGTAYPIRGPLTRIGRNSANDIVLNEPTIGRFHALLQQVGDGIFSITDQSSANGTFVNDVRIDTATLAPGDSITLGSKALRFDGPMRKH